ncbi:unnamed protein product [Durusdinium trenchii]|uniref:Uncharacterized protein n=1 Tax=Durusdinium trenchii TaxID=1381693 RepID=A0ABP0M8R8_9DINO
MGLEPQKLQSESQRFYFRVCFLSDGTWASPSHLQLVQFFASYGAAKNAASNLRQAKQFRRNVCRRNPSRLAKKLLNLSLQRRRRSNVLKRSLQEELLDEEDSLETR